MQAASPFDVAITLVTDLFPTCEFALLAGSVVREESHPGSDLDIVIVDRQAIPHWETRMVHGWPVELFVLTPTTVESAFALDVRRRWPLHITLCREGQMLIGQEHAAAIVKALADQIFVSGPAALSAEEIAQKRYDLTWQLDDFRDAAAHEELGLIGHDLLLEAADVYLVSHRHWRGRGGKWTLRMMKQAHPSMAQELLEALTALHEQQNPQPAITFAQRILDELGGRQFETQYDAYQF